MPSYMNPPTVPTVGGNVPMPPDRRKPTGTPTMETKAFALLDTEHDLPVFGLVNVAAENALLLAVVSVAGEKDWRSLDAGESVCVKDRAGVIYRMVRTR